MPPEQSSDAPASRFRWFLLIAGCLGLLAAAYWFVTTDRQPVASGPSRYAGPVPVTAIAAERADFPVVLSAVGTVTPLNTVVLRSRVEGELQAFLVEEGQMVQAGDVVARLDAALYRARLDQALGQQQQNAALLRNAQEILRRYRQLHQQQSIARQVLDEQEALVQQLSGAARIDKARVEEAQLQLDYTEIRSPVTGRLGLKRVDQGNLVSAGAEDGLATVTQVQPMSILFSLPETRLDELLPAWRADTPLAVEAWSRDDSARLAVGRLISVDNQVDTATGTVRLRAQFENGDERLFPNQFVNVRLTVRSEVAALVIPADAVQYGARGTYVYAIDEADKATVRPVRLGVENAGRVVVHDGVSDGQKVVVQGLDRLREGRQVQLMEDADAGDADSTNASQK